MARRQHAVMLFVSKIAGILLLHRLTGSGTRRLLFRLLSWNPWQHVFFRLVERLHGRQLC
ncbi:MAG: hypothetical protein IH899_06940 [Planctomycetes bacterium]|nr:hypothetical protein [Planctomycetota bacterium]